MNKPPLITIADQETRKSWRRRRFQGASIFVLLISVNLILLRSRGGSSAQLLGLTLVGALVVIAIVVAASAAHSRRMRPRPGEDALFASWGRFPLAEIERRLRFAAVVADCNTRRIARISRGMVEGRILLTRTALRFVPGTVSSRAHLSEFEIPWDDVAKVRVVPMWMNLNTGMEVSLCEGGVIHMEVRGEHALIEALNTL